MANKFIQNLRNKLRDFENEHYEQKDTPRRIDRTPGADEATDAY